MDSIPQIDSSRHFLGTLCKRGHDFDNTGSSLRAINNGGCLACHRERQAERSRRPDVKEYHRRKNAEYLRDPAKRTKIDARSKARAKQEDVKARRSQQLKNMPQEKREEINRKLRERYASDSEYRERSRQRNKRSRIKHADKRQAHAVRASQRRQERLESDPAFREHYRLLVSNRRARIRSLANDLTPTEWAFALSHFGNRCAVCGRSSDFWTMIVRDHWIPLTRDGGTTATNIIPLCHTKKGAPSGERGCNSSKHDRPPFEWLVSRFGKKEANKILQRIDAYLVMVALQKLAEAS